MRQKLFLLTATMLLFCVGAFGGSAFNALMNEISTPPAVASGDHEELLRRVNAENVLFSLSTCPYCREARTWLQQQHVPFTELVVDHSESAQVLFDELRERAFPVLITRERRIRGFNPEAYRAATVALEQAPLDPGNHD